MDGIPPIAYSSLVEHAYWYNNRTVEGREGGGGVIHSTPSIRIFPEHLGDTIDVYIAFMILFQFFCFGIEGRKPAARLDISGTPGVEQLRPVEREVITHLVDG